MNAVLWLIHQIIGLAILLLIINAILSWLIAFDVINRSNRVVNAVWDFTNRLVNPLLAPIRKVIPLVGGVDLSPLVLILLLGFLDRLIPLAIF
jgi:YggT family protein